MSDVAPSRFTNRLAREQSPYLRQHAHNPVDWHRWGNEAFAKAHAEQKPIFLSIGYSTCHWCHVMAHESFENEAIARQLNRDFVPVKVDREERPDVDRVYMTYVQAATGQGGWPLSVWLTPDLKPFYGGTYFPPEDRWGQPGFATLLGALAKAWRHEREKLIAEGERATEALRAYARGAGSRDEGRGSKAVSAGGTKDSGRELRTQNPEPSGGALIAAADEAIDHCFRHLQESFDAGRGGFGGAPKFPRPAVLNFLFRVAAQQSVASAAGAEAVQMAALTLRKMAEGGLHDHVGGGFHRYSVDGEWFVPHFEKMLYDQAQLAISYLEARQATGDERYAWVARDIFDYVRRDLANPAGGFFSAEDADSAPPENEGRRPGSGEDLSRHAEGAFYLWTKKELERVLGDDAGLFNAHFGVTAGGNVPVERDPHGEFRGKNILRQRQPLAETAQQSNLDPSAASDRLRACLARLRAVRIRRPRPHLDDKILTAVNGLMISALARGHQVLGAPDHLEPAVHAAEFLRRVLYDGETGVLYRSYREGRSDIPGFAEDYAYLVQGLLDLYEASFDLRWLQWADRLQTKMDDLFWDAEAGGYFNSRAEDLVIIARMKEDYDGAEPAPGSVAAMNLFRLEAMIGGGDPDSRVLGYRMRALKTMEALRRQWEGAPQALPQLLCALELARRPPRTVVLAGHPQADDFRALVAILHERLGPRQTLLLAADNGEDQQWLANRAPHVVGMKRLGGRATAYVCENFTCRRPVTEPGELRRLLEPQGDRHASHRPPGA
jgi:hypothetical protein